jgi:UDP-N-acetylmuramate--alanine ligase
MNIYFSGIGGVGLGPLAELAQDAGHHVQGSDPQESPTTRRLVERGISINAKQQGMFLQACHGIQPIDWFVYSSAIPEDHPELIMARMLKIKTTKRDELLSIVLSETKLKLIAVAGTHGKTSTSAMLVWAMQQLNIPVSYSIGSTLSFGPAGKYDPESEYFVYECDEYDRNFLQFHPYLSLITAVDYDHPDTYGSPEEYITAFQQFVSQSEGTIMWKHDGTLIDAQNAWKLEDDEVMDSTLPGEHTRRNATLVAKALERLDIPGDHQVAIDSFPGADRRFEKIAHNLYTDYGHHPTEIAATLQMAREVSEHVVLVYQPHQNTRQHEIRSQYTDCFELADTVYWLPTYLSRENNDLAVLTPDELTENITNIDSIYTADMDDELWETIQRARDENKLVLFMGAGSIDDWVRERFATMHIVDVLVMDQEGNFVMQRRDDKPTISNPGKVTAFGGHVESTDKSLLSAAARELHEETNLKFQAEDLAFFRMYPKTIETHNEKSYVTYYVLTGVDTTNLEVYEGQGFEIVNPNNLGDFPLSILARTVIAEYTHPAL